MRLRLAGALLLLATSWGCATGGGRSPAAESREKLSPWRFAGRILEVDRDEGFVIIGREFGSIDPVGECFARDGERQITARLATTPVRSGSISSARIVDGSPQVGDEVVVRN